MTPVGTLMPTLPRGCPLTRQQYRILTLLAEGCTHQQAAHRLGRSPSTIGTHMYRAYKKLGVTNSAQAIAHIGREGWFHTGHADEPLKPWQRCYLDAFDRWIHGDQAAETEMALAIAGIRASTGLAQPPARPRREAGWERLLNILRYDLA